jgi:site-specific DNA-methyltransferase (adenine-specific)
MKIGKDVSIAKGDCLELMKSIKDGSVDMILCDLPYGTTACKWDTVIPFEPLWEQYNRIIKDKGAIVLTASQPFTSALVMSNPKMFKYEWIWIKNRGSNFASVKKTPIKEHESCLVFYKSSPTYNPQMQERTGGGVDRVKKPFKQTRNKISEHGVEVKGAEWLTKLRYPSSWQKFNCEVGLHPTQKPVALMEYLIKTYTNEGETVLDNCMGSATTGVACINTKRRFIGIEQDDKYFDICVERLTEANQTIFK